jgi:hypothetical protein
MNRKLNAIFGSIPIISKDISRIKNGESILVKRFSDFVTLIVLGTENQNPAKPNINL